jgi:hypothetical protein
VADHFVDDSGSFGVDLPLSILVTGELIFGVDADEIVVAAVNGSLHAYILFEG